MTQDRERLASFRVMSNAALGNGIPATMAMLTITLHRPTLRSWLGDVARGIGLVLGVWRG